MSAATNGDRINERIFERHAVSDRNYECTHSHSIKSGIAFPFTESYARATPSLLKGAERFKITARAPSVWA